MFVRTLPIFHVIIKSVKLDLLSASKGLITLCNVLVPMLLVALALLVTHVGPGRQRQALACLLPAAAAFQSFAFLVLMETVITGKQHLLSFNFIV